MGALSATIRHTESCLVVQCLIGLLMSACEVQTESKIIIKGGAIPADVGWGSVVPQMTREQVIALLGEPPARSEHPDGSSHFVYWQREFAASDLLSTEGVTKFLLPHGRTYCVFFLNDRVTTKAMVYFDFDAALEGNALDPAKAVITVLPDAGSSSVAVVGRQ